MSRRERALGCIAAGRLLKVCWYGCVIEMSPTLPFFFKGNKILASVQVSMHGLCKLEVLALLSQALSAESLTNHLAQSSLSKFLQKNSKT